MVSDLCCISNSISKINKIITMLYLSVYSFIQVLFAFDV
eukprot:gene2994-1976_t